MPNFEQTEQAEALVKKIRGRVEQAEKSIHSTFLKRCDHFYNYWRSYSSLKAEYGGLDRRDRDVFLREQMGTWGADLFIPYCFSSVESILPRLLSNNPKMLVTPRESAAEENVENMRMLVSAQQAQINYGMSLQTTGKDGLIYGLGVRKTFWRREEKQKRKLVPGVSTDWIEEASVGPAFDDADSEAVDPRNFIWDPMASDMRNCRWAIHRTWRDTAYILNRVRSRIWTHFPALVDQVDALRNTGSSERYNELQQGRAPARGLSSFDIESNDVHEVWEYHGQGWVCVVVDRKWLLHCAENPYWHGELPFHVFRPVEVTHEMVGLGVVEALQDLQDEINQLRSQRRDNATIALQKPFVFNEGMFDTGDLQLGPGLGIPTTGDAREALFPIDFGEIPNSGYREEENLRSDIERTVGISDAVAGGEGSGPMTETATGAQLMHSAAGERIKNMTLRIEGETITPEARQFLALNQQFITQERELRYETPPIPLGPGVPDARYLWFPVGPGELAGDMEIEAIGGSTAAENVPQLRADGQALWGIAANNPMFNQRKIAAEVLEKFGYKNPDEFLAPEDGSVPAEALNTIGQLLEQSGVQPEVIQQAIQTAIAQHQQQEEGIPAEGPGAPPQDQQQEQPEQPQGVAA